MIVMAVNSAGMARVFIDTAGTFITTGKAGLQYGVGGGVGVSIYRNLSVLYHGQYTLGSKQLGSSYLVTDFSYSHMTHLVGIEYLFPIDQVRLGWKSAIKVGYASTSIDVENKYLTAFYYNGLRAPITGIEKRKDAGIALGLWTGVVWNATQVLSPFLDVGFHAAMFSNKLQNYPLYGASLIVGVRFNITKAKRIDDDL